MPFCTENDHFAKTGSGQTQEKLRNKSAFSCSGATVGQPTEVEDFGPCLTPQVRKRVFLRHSI